MESKSKLLKEHLLIKEDILSEAKKIGIDKLPFGFRSVSSFIDGKTMDVHYNKHYKGYVEKLNKALSKKNYGDVELENIVKSISKYNKTIRNNAGGAFNHALFWKMLSPKKQDIPNGLKSKIIKEFGSVNNFKKEFSEIAKDRFGSGWAWLVLTKNNRLKIMSTPNQDNPLMNIIDGGGFPILGLDVWEHAYYLKYQNKRDEYINNFWDVVNWEFVNTLYNNKTKPKVQKNKLKETVEKNNFLINESQHKQLINIFEAKKHAEYETSLTGNVFKKFQTSLRINFRCDKDMFNYISLRGFKKFVNKVYENEYNKERIIENLIVCVLYYLEEQKEPLKADLIAVADGFDENGKPLFYKGDYAEVKMMDVDTDSFLSEILSIFKNSKKEDEFKKMYIPTYNYIIKRLYDAIKNNGIALDFLERIKSRLCGVIFDNNIFVPIKFVKLYWSDKGQRDCGERRLSIRFKVLPEFDNDKLEMYKLEPNSQILKKYEGRLVSGSSKEISC